MLGAGEFLAVDEQDGFVGAVDDHQVRDGAGGGNFRDGDVPGGEGLAEGAVLECAVRRGDERQDGDVFVGLSFSELNRLQPSFHCVFHTFLSFLAKGSFAGLSLTRGGHARDRTGPVSPIPTSLAGKSAAFPEFTSNNLPAGYDIR